LFNDLIYVFIKHQQRRAFYIIALKTALYSSLGRAMVVKIRISSFRPTALFKVLILKQERNIYLLSLAWNYY